MADKSTIFKRAYATGEKLFKTGFFHVFGAGSINKVSSALLSFVLVRILSKADYGVYAYAFNIISFFVIFNGMGALSAILQICSERYEDTLKKNSFFFYGYKCGIVIDVALTVVILLVAILIPLQIQGTNVLLGMYCLYPIVMLLFLIKTTYLRVDLRNKEYSQAMNLQTALIFVLSIVGAMLFQAPGLIIGQIASYVIAYIFLCWRFPFKRTETEKLSSLEQKDYWKIASISTFNDGLTMALNLTGTFFIGAYLANDILVADYRVACLIPNGLFFVPAALMTYAYPYFARNKDNYKWTKKNYGKLMLGYIGMNGFIVLALILLAKPLFAVLFGEEYLNVVPIFIITMLAFFFQATFSSPAGNLMVTQRKLIVNSCSGVIVIGVNILCCTTLIPIYGIYGAAYSQLITSFVSGLLFSGSYIVVLMRLKKRQ